MSRQIAEYSLGTLDAADETTKMILVRDFVNCDFTIILNDSFAGTLKFYTSNNDVLVRPDLTEAQSATNEYSTVEIKDLEGTTTDGEDGIVFTGSETNIVVKIELNTNEQNWIGVKCTARTAGSVTISAILSDNQ